MIANINNRRFLTPVVLVSAQNQLVEKEFFKSATSLEASLLPNRLTRLVLSKLSTLVRINNILALCINLRILRFLLIGYNARIHSEGLPW